MFINLIIHRQYTHPFVLNKWCECLYMMSFPIDDGRTHWKLQALQTGDQPVDIVGLRF